MLKHVLNKNNFTSLGCNKLVAKALASALVFGAVVACESEEEDGSMSNSYTIVSKTDEQDRCGVRQIEERFKNDPETLAKLREESKNNRKIRVVGHGEPMTMDYRFDRVNVVIDDEKNEIMIYCG